MASSDITIHINMFGGQTIDVTCDPTITTMEDLKFYLLLQPFIQETIGDLNENNSDIKRLSLTRLNSNGSFEKLDNKTLSGYGIVNDDELHLVVQPKVVIMNDEQALQATELLQSGNREEAVHFLSQVTNIDFLPRWNPILFSILPELPNLHKFKILFRRQLDIDLLAQYLSTCRNLEELDLSSLGLGQEGVHEFVPALEQLRSLHSLDLSNNNIGDDEVTELAPALANCRELERLNLAFNDIGDSGVVELASALVNCRDLKALVLTRNNITDEGVSLLVQALETLPSLKELYIGSNEISENGATELVRLLSFHPTLEIYGIGQYQTDDSQHSGAKHRRCRSCGKRRRSRRSRK